MNSISIQDAKRLWWLHEQRSKADPQVKKIIERVMDTSETIEQAEAVIRLLLDSGDGILTSYAQGQIQAMREKGWMTPEEAQEVGKATYDEHKARYDKQRKAVADELSEALIQFKGIVGATNPKLQALINRIQQLIEPGE